MQPTIGRIVHYTNLGDKDGKYPPEVQAALVTGVYRNDPAKLDQPRKQATHGQNEPADLCLVSANKLGDTPDAAFVDLTVFYRTGYFQIKCVPLEVEPKRGCANWPPRA